MKSFFLQVFIVLVIFNGVSAVRESGMLSSWQNETAPEFILADFKHQPTPLIANSDTLAPINALTTNTKTILYFFAPWCSVCRVSIKNLQNTYERDPNIKIKAIALDYENQQAVFDFAENLNLKFPILFGNEQVKKAYKVSAYPSYYVVDEQGKIEHRSMGYSTELGLFFRSL